MVDCITFCEVEVKGKEDDDVNKLIKVCCAISSPTSIKSLPKFNPSNRHTNFLLVEQLPR